MALLKKGLRGEPVRRLQAKLGVEVDGIFGPGTDRALRAYQKENALSVDGIAGPDTFSHMELYELVLLRKGARGKTVRRLQEALGTGADGIFGKGTEAAVRTFQKAQGLSVDGIAGPATLAKMELFVEMTEAVVEQSKLPEDYVEPELPPNVSWADEGKSVAVEEEVKKEESGIWSTVKGWFS